MKKVIYSCDLCDEECSPALELGKRHICKSCLDIIRNPKKKKRGRPRKVNAQQELAKKLKVERISIS